MVKTYLPWKHICPGAAAIC